MKTIIQQGDQYYIPVKITMDGAEVTPDNVTDVRIQLGNYLRSYADEEVSYSTDDAVWLFPVTEQETRALLGETSFQVGIKVTEDTEEYIYSPVITVQVGQSIIRESWATT